MAIYVLHIEMSCGNMYNEEVDSKQEFSNETIYDLAHDRAINDGRIGC